MDEGPAAAPGTERTELVEDLFRKEYAHLVSALTRMLGPANLPLVEDVVHDALVSAMQAWRFGPPKDPKAWLVRVAHNRAVDVIRREQRLRSLLPELATTTELTATVEAALAPAAESAGQLAMMFAVCDPGLNRETHVTLILRWLCGLSPREIGRAFLVDTQTIDRRLHRGRARLRQLGRLPDVDGVDAVDAVHDRIASHTRRQVFCFGPDGLLRRHDFTIDVLGGATGMLYATGYRDADGIVVPATRRGYAWQGDAARPGSGPGVHAPGPGR